MARRSQGSKLTSGWIKGRRLYDGLAQELGPWWRAKNKKSLLLQAREAARLWATYRTPPTQYLRANLYLADAGRPEAYLPFAVVEHFQNVVNASRQSAILHDKVLFHDIMQRHGVPSIPTLAIVSSASLQDAAGNTLGSPELSALIGQTPVFVKGKQGRYGKGAFRSTGLTPAQIADLQKSADTYLVQPLVEQCEVLSAFHPSSLNTIRIATYRGPDGKTVPLAATLKMGMKGSHVDNMSHGGLFVGVDLDIGALRGWGVSTSTGSARLLFHPDTGVPFQGIRIPFWTDSVALVLRAAEALPELGTVGWDVAVSPDGPILVEGNKNWSATLFQSVATPLGCTALAEPALAAWRARRARGPQLRGP